jgi:perosamine synthetase
MRKIPFYRPCIGAEEIDEVVATLKSGWLTTGPRTKQFEGDFAAYLGHKHAVAVNSCTAALHLALEALGLKPGQGVIVPTMTFAATAEVVRNLGARPLLADCRPKDFNLDVADAERRIRSALQEGLPVAAIMPVDYGGQIGDVAGVRDLARRYHLKIVEDAAHCCPAYYREAEPGPAPGPAGPARSPRWQAVGHGADFSCYSFYANKAITTGEGGMVCTQSEEYAERMRIMSLHGISRDAWKRYTGEGSWYYEIIAPGFKYNLSDLAAAIGLHQLRKADRLHQRRSALAGQYHAALKEVEEIVLPRVMRNRIHSWHLYVIRLKLDQLCIDRRQFIARLQQRGITASVHWMPLHLHPYYRQTYAYRPQDLPTANSLYPEIVSLPLYPDLQESDLHCICEAIKDILRRNRRRPRRPRSVRPKLTGE